MAKKSGGSLMKVILDIITIVLGGLVFAFLALPFHSSSIGEHTIGSVSGYDYIDFGDLAPKGCAIVLLLLLIFAGIMILGAVMKLLCDINVVKSSGFAKFANFMTIIGGLMVAVLSIVNIITVSVYLSDTLGGVFDTGWAALIIIAIVGVASLATSALTVRKK